MRLGGRMTNPGELRTRGTLQTVTLSKDAGGAQVETWANFATNPTVYIKIKYAHGPESVSTDAKHAVSRMTLMMRYRSDVHAGHAILLGSERWKFVSAPDNIENRNEYLEIQAELVKGTV